MTSVFQNVENTCPLKDYFAKFDFILVTLFFYCGSFYMHGLLILLMDLTKVSFFCLKANDIIHIKGCLCFSLLLKLQFMYCILCVFEVLLCKNNVFMKVWQLLTLILNQERGKYVFFFYHQYTFSCFLHWLIDWFSFLGHFHSRIDLIAQVSFCLFYFSWRQQKDHQCNRARSCFYTSTFIYIIDLLIKECKINGQLGPCFVS